MRVYKQRFNNLLSKHHRHDHHHDSQHRIQSTQYIVLITATADGLFSHKKIFVFENKKHNTM